MHPSHIFLKDLNILGKCSRPALNVRVGNVFPGSSLSDILEQTISCPDVFYLNLVLHFRYFPRKLLLSKLTQSENFYQETLQGTGSDSNAFSRLWVKSQQSIREAILMTLFSFQRTTHVSLLKYTLQATRDGSCLIKPDKASLKMRLGETYHVDCRAAQFSLERTGSCVLFGRGGVWHHRETRQKLLPPSSCWRAVTEHTRSIFNAN